MAGDTTSSGKDPRTAWNEVGQSFSDVGKRVSQRYREERGTAGSTRRSARWSTSSTRRSPRSATPFETRRRTRA